MGPDYIDPGYHGLAAGRPGRNLDPWLVGAERIPGLLAHGALTPIPADIAVVEGVMGLYDGVVGRGEFASTAHVARLVEAPVVLVVDVSGQGRSAGALALGMAGFDPRVRIGGVVLNRVGSARHDGLLRQAMAEVGIAVLGSIPRTDQVTTPSRHLGLVPVAERAAESLAVVEALGTMMTEHLELDALLDLARTAPPLATDIWDPTREIATTGEADELVGVACGARAPAGAGPVVAVAGGAAFTFSYRESIELLEAAGAQVQVFDPLHDTALPAGTRGLVIGGGFPEVHAERLAANTTLLAEVAAFDGPIVAECAGLLYLGTSLDGVPMAGRLPVVARMSGRLTLGYRDAVAATDSPLARRGESVHGHEFHRTTTSPAHGPAAAWQWDGTSHGFVAGKVHASYLHTHAAGRPQSARRFVQACA